ncbi:MAG TPA: cytochrome d ubiquinol oxidase subunit II [Mycobacteriales bacterium]|nr:cytochrome d ubiquinol oxidase subunit II [Mycobacteriales bacterium]
MIAVDVAAALLWVTLTAYAITGGADFGGGVWDLLAGGAKRGEPVRRLIDESITPVWEANHVWLIITLVLFWTEFPPAFAAVTSTLFVPLSLVALGVVFRGAGFAYRKPLRRLFLQQLTGATFALSSLVTPFFMGAAAGAIVTGRVPADGQGNRVTSWTTPTCLLIGALSVVAFAFLAAVYLAADARRRGDGPLVRYFALRGLVTGALTGGLGAAALTELHAHASLTFHHFAGGGPLALLVVSGVLGLSALTLLAVRAGRGVRVIGAAAFATMLWAWAVAQYPRMLPGAFSLHAAAAPTASLVTEMVVFGAIVVLAGPSLILLYSLAQRGLLGESGEAQR